MSQVVTFYSYKGGVGRTFATANIAVLLAKRGKKVLLMDWDLEAPGLDEFFKDHLRSSSHSKNGLIHLLSHAAKSRKADWRPYVRQIKIKGHTPLSIITS